MSSERDSIDRRRQEIAAEIAKLQKEDDELVFALSILDRYSGKAAINGSPAGPKLGPARPVGAPKLIEMVRSALISAEKDGRGGLTGTELVKEIGAYYWPGVNGPQILPTIYQFAKKGRIIKSEDGKFRRSK